jgi:hypothetical protein
MVRSGFMAEAAAEYFREEELENPELSALAPPIEGPRIIEHSKV